MTNEETIARLLEALKDGLSTLGGVKEIAIAFSGGLDSTVVTATAMGLLEGAVTMRPFVVGLPDSKDLLHAKLAAKELDIELNVVQVSKEEVLSSIQTVSRYTQTTDPVVVSFTLPLYFVLKEKGPRKVLVGHGGDELFGGYARYLDMCPLSLQEHLDSDLDLLKGRAEKDRKMAEDLGRELIAPMLDHGFMAAAKGLPMEMKVADGERKIALRMMARRLGLSDAIVNMKKTAAQYGSGIMKVLKKESKNRGYDGVEELIRTPL